MFDRDYLEQPLIEKHEGFYVLRDDLLEGGTKVRALNSLVPQLESDALVYPASSSGAGAWALSESCRRHHKQAVLYFDKSCRFGHETIDLCYGLGADIRFSEADGRVARYEAALRHYTVDTDAYVLPPGFDIPEFRSALGQAFVSIVEACDPSEIWVASSSGSISRSLQAAMPHRSHNVVIVSDDKNIDVGNARKYNAKEAFSEVASGVQPPFPSCANYDAKAWDVMLKNASPNALFINVAGPIVPENG